MTFLRLDGHCENAFGPHRLEPQAHGDSSAVLAPFAAGNYDAGIGGRKMLRIQKKRNLAVIVVLALLVCAIPLHSDSSKRVLLVARETSEDMEYWLTKEVIVIIKLLTDAGYEVATADQSGKPIVAGKTQLTVDCTLAEARVESYAGIVVPCMGAGSLAGNAPAAGVALLREANATGKPIAAQNADAMLRPAGLYMKRKVATKPGVVRDGNLITSYNCPYMAMENGQPVDTPELIACFVAALSGN